MGQKERFMGQDDRIFVEIDEFDVDDFCSNSLEATAFGHLDAGFLKGYVNFEAKCSWSVDVAWEPDGEPTYVPYGDGQALFDDGRGGVDSVSVRDGSLDEVRWSDEDGKELSDDQVKSLLEVDDDGFNGLLDEILSDTGPSAHVEAEAYADRLERPEPEGPDYSDWL